MKFKKPVDIADLHRRLSEGERMNRPEIIFALTQFPKESASLLVGKTDVQLKDNLVYYDVFFDELGPKEQFDELAEIMRTWRRKDRHIIVKSCEPGRVHVLHGNTSRDRRESDDAYNAREWVAARLQHVHLLPGGPPSQDGKSLANNNKRVHSVKHHKRAIA